MNLKRRFSDAWDRFKHDETGAVCVGCGLEVNNGILEVNVCGTPITPNTTTGGLQCDTATESGCLKVVLNDSHAGCGLNASATGQLEVDPCDKGGILCGATDDDAEDNCIYVNVQKQGGGPCIVLTSASTTGGGSPGSDAGPHVSFGPGPLNGTCDLGSSNASPNCNGLVRTCDGLWAPPKIPSVNFNCGQWQLGEVCGGVPDPGTSPFTINNLLFPIGAQAGTLPASAQQDMALGNTSSQIIIYNRWELDACLPIDTMSFTTFSLVFFVPAGERWVFRLWEGLQTLTSDAQLCAIDPGVDIGWCLQATATADRVGQPGGYEYITFNDISTWDNGAGPGYFAAAAMVTGKRLIGAGAPTNEVVQMNLQYRNIGHGYHYSVSKNCGKSGTG